MMAKHGCHPKVVEAAQDHHFIMLGEQLQELHIFIE
jgi:hypothetical protein